MGYCRIGTYTTDSSGKISIPNLTVGTQYRVTETVPEGYEAEAQSQEITLQAGTNTLTFVNHRLLALEILKTSDDGKVSGISFTVERLVSGSGYQNWEPTLQTATAKSPSRAFPLEQRCG